MMRRAETQQSVLVALLGSLFFAVLFFLAANQVLARPSIEAAAAGESVSRSIRGELGGWLRSGPFTLVVRGGAYDGTKNVELTAYDDALACRIRPEDLEPSGVLLRCEMDLDSPVVALHRLADGTWREVRAERYVDRGYVQVPVTSFGEYRFETR